MKNQKEITPRVYIAPDKTGEVNKIKVKAVSLLGRSLAPKNLMPMCLDCCVKDMNICFKDEVVGVGEEKHIVHKHLSTRPACFGNDPENSHRTPIYYVKA